MIETRRSRSEEITLFDQRWRYPLTEAAYRPPDRWQDLSALTWQTSSYSADVAGNVLRVAFTRPPEAGVLLRDATDPAIPIGRGDLVLALSSAEWHAFLDGVRAGQFDRPAAEPAAPDAPAPAGAPAVWREPGGPTWLVSSLGQGLRGSPLMVALPQTATPGVCLRDVIDPGGPALTVSPAAWRVFLNGVRAGEFDHPPQPRDVVTAAGMGNGRDTAPATAALVRAAPTPPING